MTTFKKDIAIAVAAAGLLIALHIAYPSTAIADFVIRAAAMGIFASSLNLLVGQTGMVSFGHGMFFGLGAYALVYLMQNTTLPLGAVFILSLAAAAACATIVGAICVKLRDHYFAFCTLALQMLLYSMIYTAVSWTGGDQGLGGIPRRHIFGLDLGQGSGLYLVSVGLLIGTLLLLRFISRSAFGVTLRMIRDNEPRALFVGVPVLRIKLVAFIISSTIASTGGMLMALFISGAYPELANWTVSGQAIFSIVLGGVNTFLGPLVGSTILLLLNDVVTRITDYYGLVLGLVILAFVLGLRTGVVDIIIRLGAMLRVKRNGRPEEVGTNA